jgi:hypothetical protein
MNPNNRVALYARVSTANGQQDPEMQLRELREYAEHRGLTIIGARQPVAGYNAVQTWSDYQDFKRLLRRIGLRAYGNMFISRDDDRALWVYGHLFK